MVVVAAAYEPAHGLSIQRALDIKISVIPAAAYCLQPSPPSLPPPPQSIQARGGQPPPLSEPSPAPAAWRAVGEVEHGFTHFTLTLQLYRAEGEADGLIWTPRRGLDALPSVFLKAAKAGLANLL